MPHIPNPKLWAALATLGACAPLCAAPAAAEPEAAIEVVKLARHDLSRPLRELPVVAVSTKRKGRVMRSHNIPLVDEGPELALDSLLANSRQAAQRVAPAEAVGVAAFDGVGEGFTGPAGSYSVNVAPPDPTGAVGMTQYVQWVNLSFAVFDKATRQPIYGPVDGRTLWQGFGGDCERYNDGDPIVQYDKLAHRWVLSQFAVSGNTQYQCVAVSTSDDAMGTYHRYQFAYKAMNDFPKLSVWPDAYYVTYNMFKFGFIYQGALVCALDRAKMLAGEPATQQCVQMPSSYGSMLAADLDGAAPASAQPGYVVSMAANSLNVWQFKVDWSTPANTKMMGPVNVPVAPYSRACNGFACVQQPGTSNALDAIGDRLNFRAAYRQFADRDSLLLAHSVSTGTGDGSVTGVRWYELTGLAGTPRVVQQGTHSPDTAHRWMASIAQDKQGNIGLLYSISSGTQFPSMAVARHLRRDPPGTMRGETLLAHGGGSQTGLTRWGDYSHMSVDPADDCTFWGTAEYNKATGSFNWSTRIATAKVPGCK